MFVRSIRVKNFRTFRDSGDVPFSQFTALIGPNGAGKSTLLRALDLFYDLSATITAEDCHHRSSTDPVSITVTFDRLNSEETSFFGSMVRDGVLTVEKRFHFAEGGAKGQYIASLRQHHPFAGIRARSGRDKISAYGDFRAANASAYPDLPTARSGEAVDAALVAWEQAHDDRLDWVPSPVPFFGARNVGGGSLDNYTRFVRIPAVREASVLGADTRGSAMGDLVNILVKEVMFQSPQLAEFRQRMVEEFARITEPAAVHQVPELERRLQERMCALVPRSSIHLVVGSPKEPTFVLPEIRAELTEDDFRGSIEGKGHGLQRSFIIAILQELAYTQAHRDHQARLGQGGAVLAMGADFRPDLILAIEEPELFQHPIRQKHFANVLRELAAAQDVEGRPHVQVLITTHSPHFVSMRHFDDLRLVKKQVSEIGTLESVVRIGRIEEACDRFCAARGIHTPNYENFRDGLRNVVDSKVAEAFFADCAVVVEGADDHAALTAALSAAGFDPVREGVPIVEAGGKPNMSRIKAVLDTLGVPTYLVFDCDGHRDNKRHANEMENKSLQQLCETTGQFDVFPLDPVIEAVFACFPQTLEHTMAAELLDFSFMARRDEIAGRRMVNAKNPVVYEEVFQESYQAGYRSPTLDRIVEAIKALHERCRDPVADLVSYV